MTTFTRAELEQEFEAYQADADDPQSTADVMTAWLQRRRERKTG